MALGAVLEARPPRALELARAARPAPRVATPAGRPGTRFLPAREPTTSPSDRAPDAEAEAQAQEDRELVARCRAKDEAAFRRLVEKYQERAFWIARGMIGNDE